MILKSYFDKFNATRDDENSFELFTASNGSQALEIFK